MHYGTRVLFYVLIAGVIIAGYAGLNQSVVKAQDGNGSSTGADELSESTDGGDSGEPAKKKKRKTLLSAVMAGGVGWVLIFLLLSLVAVGFIIEHFLTIRKTALMPEDVLGELENMINQGQVDQALEVCLNPDNESMVAIVIAAGLERYKASEFGFAEYKTAVEEAGEDQTGRLYRKTEVLGVIGSIAPMLGLTGTVVGMIVAFNTIAEEQGMATPEQLANGIGQALVTTLLGLVVAIPAMIFFSFFRNRIDSIVAEAGKRVEQVLMPLGRRK